MKSLFAFVESFPLYVEGDLGEAFVKVQILSELQNYSLTIIGQQVHEFRSGGFRKSSLSFYLVTSSPTEPRAFLYQQQLFLHDLLHMRLGAHGLTSSAAQKQQTSQTRSLVRIMRRYLSLCDNSLAFMIHELEWLALNESLKGRIRTAVVDALKRTTNGTHALLLVNAKIAYYEKAATATALTNSDMLLLVVSACELLGIRASPEDTEVEFAKAPIMQYLFLPNADGQQGRVLHYVTFCPVAPDVSFVVLSQADARMMAKWNDRPFQEEFLRENVAPVVSRLSTNLSDILDFIVFKSSRHLSMWAFTDIAPGLVHFVFVDRTNHIVLAPLFDPLSGSHLGPETAAVDQKLLREAFTDVVFSMFELAATTTSCIHRTDKFLYYYRRWAEDRDGAEVHVDLVSRVARRCEFYALFVGTVSAEAADAHFRTLVAKLKEA